MIGFDVISEELGQRPGQRVGFVQGGARVSYASAMQALRDVSAVRRRLIEVLAAAPFEAFFWEVVPVCRRSWHRPFEFVVLPAHALVGVEPEPRPFADRFRKEASVVDFDNLGKDARLVVPCPVAAAAVYPHLATFVRQAPATQRERLFECVATQVMQALGERPLWVSTAGTGVAWLHVRLDSRPKYYQFPEYRHHRLPQ